MSAPRSPLVYLHTVISLVRTPPPGSPRGAFRTERARRSSPGPKSLPILPRRAPFTATPSLVIDTPGPVSCTTGWVVKKKSICPIRHVFRITRVRSEFLEDPTWRPEREGLPREAPDWRASYNFP
ncbi:uncharacterized protein STAUR_7891 [Stigmatella aurantiaca DW4/3-1]|uniref:Uncharacterized protein n=1 Tax=Stigmatella aurantiaca (strain DW4/3-1) TaxID=378806 RepID=E3FNH3_STIAD|nr:uncharacterized protein STAUR_7891 [Stigmatella aurantiaca DW4/3-1]